MDGTEIQVKLLNKNDHEDDGRDEVEHVWLEGQVTFVGNGFVSVDRNAFCGNGTSRKTGQRPLELGDRVRYTKQLNTKRNSHSKFKVIELVLLDDNVGNANAKKGFSPEIHCVQRNRYVAF